MNMIAAMAGITDSNFLKQYMKDNIDIITLGGYSCHNETYNAARKIVDRGRCEFIVKPEDLADHINCEVNKLRNYKPKWKGKICANIRATNPESFKNLDNCNVDIIEVNAHCRQPEMIKAKTGQTLLGDIKRLEAIIEYVCDNLKCELSLKMRANVDNIDTIEIIEMLESYPIQYIHIDAMKPGVMMADLDIINTISNITSKHLIGNNSVKTHKDYINMINSGADSVSIARAAVNCDIDEIFRIS